MALAAEQAGAAPIVAGLPQGWDTPLGRQFSNGAPTCRAGSGSGWPWPGRCSRCAPGPGCWCWTSRPPSLDVRGEAAGLRPLPGAHPGLTTIVISHRFSTVRRADRIVVLEHGQVVEDGSHDQLVALGGRYATMYRLQAARFQAAPDQVEERRRVCHDIDPGAFRLMVEISWRADRGRSVAALVTASGQMIAAPLIAWSVKRLVDGVVAHDRSTALLGALLLVGFTAGGRLMTWASFNVRMRLRENTQVYLDARLMALTAGIPGIEHHERPEYLDKVELLREEREYLANPFNPISWSLASVVQAVGVVALLAAVNPWLLLLPLFGLPSVLATFAAEQADVRLRESQAEPERDAPAPAGAGHPGGARQGDPHLRPGRRDHRPPPRSCGARSTGPSWRWPCATTCSPAWAGCCSPPGTSGRWRW